MNLKRLEYFITIAQTGNLTKAAEILHLSPPALSKAMKLLEEEIGISLWNKSGRGILLTDAGVLLLKKAPHLMESIHEIKHSLHSNDNVKKPIRIGTFEVFSTYFLRFMDELKWNQHALELHELLPGEIEQHLIANNLDYGLTYLPIPDPKLDFLKVMSIEMGVFIKQGEFENTPQSELPFVVPVMPLTGIPSKVRGLDGWPEDAYERKIIHRVTLLESAMELCRQGRVAGYFPTFIVHEHNKRVKKEFQLVRKKSPSPGKICTSDVYLVKRKSDEEDTILKQLAKALRIICK